MSDDVIPAAVATIGYKRPPAASRFRKGQSGNPRGRPRGRHRDIPYDTVLGQMVIIREDGRERRVTAAEAFLLQLTRKGLDGDNAAARASLTANEAARRPGVVASSLPTEIRIALVISRLGPLVEKLDMAVKKHARDEQRVRRELKPWIVQAAFDRLGDTNAFDIDKLRPPLFTLVAVEEPENSLSPHYLGRVLRTLSEFAEDGDAQAVIATHAPSLLRRVEPESIRYLRLDEERRTTVSRITMPSGAEANKYVREAIQAFPELYFARLLILGEGDSEEVVLPRLLAARGILADDASISVVPLGGRHVNHFWRLLSDLGIPFVTLLDLDLARHQGGWGRIKYAAKQLLRFQEDPVDFDGESADAIPKWNSEQGLMIKDDGWIATLEKNAVFFSSPLDLDFMMIEAFPDAYGLIDTELEDPDDGTIDAVLGKSHDVLGGQYDDAQQQLFVAYQARFKLGSKPSWHIRAIAKLDDNALLEGLPEVLDRMFDRIEEKLAELPE